VDWLAIFDKRGVLDAESDGDRTAMPSLLDDDFTDLFTDPIWDKEAVGVALSHTYLTLAINL
jgi:hypothetical protein